eukprot:Tamp_29140.p2 GENE.Tamp_29140~~Tamp_29140.p2  ORF type:complete len:172 (-),score=18.95 Tamp_29140:268-741(-)
MPRADGEPRQWRDTGRQEAIDAARANPFRAFVGSVASGAGAGAIVGMLTGAVAGIAAGRMQLGLTVVTRGVGVGSALGAALSAASFTAEGRFTATRPPAAEPVQPGSQGAFGEKGGRGAVTKRQLVDELERLRKREKEAGVRLDDEKKDLKRRIRDQ